MFISFGMSPCVAEKAHSTATGIAEVETHPAKMNWWLDDKFGLFIHWGPSSVAGIEIGWARESHPFDHPGKLELMPDAEYDALYKQFNPVSICRKKLVHLTI